VRASALIMREAAREPTEEQVPPDPGGCAFGPGFFLGQLRAFARDECPDPAEGLPAVVVHLATGEDLSLCHVAGLAPSFVALVVREPDAGDGRMHMELVPYALITRVTIRPSSRADRHVGFDATLVPHILGGRQPLSPEAALRRAATPPLVE
jgi:hypothetical protein